MVFDGEERAQAIKCVAAPNIDDASELLGAVGVSAPSVRRDGSSTTGVLTVSRRRTRG